MTTSVVAPSKEQRRNDDFSRRAIISENQATLARGA